MFFLQISRFLDSNSQLLIHKMMTDCLHYKDYARDAIKLVIEKLEGEEVDGRKGGEMWKSGPGPPATLRRHWLLRKIIQSPRARHINARSLAKPYALDQLLADLTGYHLDIAIVTETHLKKHHLPGLYRADSFQIFRRDRLARIHGGLP